MCNSRFPIAPSPPPPTPPPPPSPSPFAHTRASSPSPIHSTRLTFGLQHTGQSSTYSCSPPPDTSIGITTLSPQLGQTYAPSSPALTRFLFLFRRSILPAYHAPF